MNPIERQGHEAYGNGVPRTANPYWGGEFDDIPEATEWYKGWDYAAWKVGYNAHGSDSSNT